MSFDPNDLWDISQTCRYFAAGGSSPIDPSTLYRGIKAGRYPKPIKIGAKYSRWRRSECEAALEKIMASSNSKPEEAPHES